MLIDLPLEVIHDGAVRQERQGIQQVHELVADGILAKEALHIGPGKELHAHGVGLGGLHAAHAQLHHEAIFCRLVVGKGVAGLVGHHVHIPGGAVEIGQDEGLMIGREAGAVPAAPLVLPGLHVEGLGLQHEVDELPCLLAHAVVHGFGRGENRLFSALGGGIALGEDQVIVIEHEGIDP